MTEAASRHLVMEAASGAHLDRNRQSQSLREKTNPGGTGTI